MMAGAPLLFAIGGSESLGERIAGRLGIDLSPLEERAFEDGEFKIRPLVSVRNRDVYVVHALNGDRHRSSNDKLCRLLFFIGALKDSAAARATAVVPYLCFARKDRQTKPRDPVTTRYVAQLFDAVGVDRVAAMEVHNLAVFQNAFRCDTDHLDANAVFIEHLKPLIGDTPVAVVSPDPGGVKRADIFHEALEAALGRPVGGGLMEKHRSMGKVTGDTFAGDVAGRTVIILDDMISTGGTMARAAAACRAAGAGDVYLVATHGLFSEGADETLGSADARRVVVANTVAGPPLSGRLASRLDLLDVSGVFADLIRRSSGSDR